MALVQIPIRRVGNDAVPPQPMPTMHVGDTVEYSSNDGQVSVEFHDGSPFQETVLGPGKIVTATVAKPGRFRCRCFIDLNDGTGRIGWRSDPSLSGADHDVPR